jgi:flagellar motor switch protein FliG
MKEMKPFSYQDYAEYAVIKNDAIFIAMGIQAIERNIDLLDYTDIVRNLSLLYHSTEMLNINADQYFKEYANKTKNKEVQEQIFEFIARSTEDKSIEVMGYIVKHSPSFHYDYL